MRIMILLKFPLYGGGSGTYTRKLAETLASNKKNQVAIVAPDNREVKGCKVYTIKPAFKCVFESHPEYKRPKRYAKLSGSEFTRQYTSFLNDIVKAVEDFKPDVIHVNHASFLSWIASFIKSMFGISYIVTVHGTDIYNSTIDPRYRVLTAQAMERADGIIAVSNHTKKWFLKVFGQKLKRKVKVIPNCIVLKDYPKKEISRGFEKKYNINGKKVVLFAGRLTWEKGIEYLIKAAKDIEGEIFIIGGGSHKKSLQHLAKLSGVKNVRFLGYFSKDDMKDLKDFYRRADVLVLPSVVEESTGLVVLEAMACSTPVVASKKGGIPIVVKDGYNGFLVRARSSKHLAEAVNKILSNDQLRLKLGTNARKIIEERFNWDAIAPQFVSIYERASDITAKFQRVRSKALFDRDEVKREKEELEKKISFEPLAK